MREKFCKKQKNTLRDLDFSSYEHKSAPLETRMKTLLTTSYVLTGKALFCFFSK